jgi:hypothetical protein
MEMEYFVCLMDPSFEDSLLITSLLAKSVILGQMEITIRASSKITRQMEKESYFLTELLIKEYSLTIFFKAKEPNNLRFIILKAHTLRGPKCSVD